MKICLHRFFLFVFVTVAATSCTHTAQNQSGPETLQPTDKEALAHPYLIAKGYGQTPAEAKKSARSELSNIFESRVESDTDSLAESIQNEEGESFQKTIKMRVRILSTVDLEGVTVSDPQQQEDGSYMAQAKLDRHAARESWQHQWERLSAEINAFHQEYQAATTPLLRVSPTKQAMETWAKREVVASRLRVIGFPAITADDPKDFLETITQARSDIRKNLIFYLDITGSHQNQLRQALGNGLGKSGFQIQELPAGANARIEGDVKVRQLDMDNPGWVFAKAHAVIQIIDTQSGSQIAEIRKSVRKGKLDYTTAAEAAVEAAATEIINDLEVFF